MQGRKGQDFRGGASARVQSAGTGSRLGDSFSMTKAHSLRPIAFVLGSLAAVSFAMATFSHGAAADPVDDSPTVAAVIVDAP